MKLVWFIYSNLREKDRRTKKRRAILAICIGELYDKYHFLISDKIGPVETTLIRANIKDLKMQDILYRLKWFKETMPNTFRNAYKTIFKNRINILEEYEITALDNK